ncbi:MAG: hypothetical protein P8X89_02005 [Reinekea sp.]
MACAMKSRIQVHIKVAQAFEFLRTGRKLIFWDRFISDQQRTNVV